MKTFALTALVVIAITGSNAQYGANQDPINVVCNPSEDGYVVFVPHPYECNKYFMCQGTMGYVMSCPGDLQFDADLNVCNYEWAVNCVNTPYPTTSTTEIPETTTADDEDNTTVFAADYEDYSL